jgi:hypothetical protein
METISLLVGNKKLGKLTPILPDGTTAQYQAGSIQVISADPTVLAIYPGKSENYIVIVGLCPGITTGIITFNTHLGHQVFKKFDVEVTAIEASDIKIEWSDL